MPKRFCILSKLWLKDGIRCVTGHPIKIRIALKREVSTVARKGFVAYFLINYHLQVYPEIYFYGAVVGGANSILAYLLQITG
jgi:DNA polymerase III alpha subunit